MGGVQVGGDSRVEAPDAELDLVETDLLCV